MKSSVERLKFILAVVTYGTIGMFLRYVSLPSELVALCRGVIGAGCILLMLALQKKHRTGGSAGATCAGFWLPASFLGSTGSSCLRPMARPL